MDHPIPLTPHSKALLEHRDELLAEAKRCGLTDVRVFGSMARGDADENSDIDLLVTILPGTKGGFELMGLSVLVEEVTGRKVDLVFDSQMKPQPGECSSQAIIRKSILEDAIPL